MQEFLLYDIWQSHANKRRSLFWKGNTLKIIDSGELNRHYGPDIQHARFEFNGTIFQGSVEFHVNIDDWYKHQHHYDPLYQDVLLHVIGREQKNTNNVIHNISKKEIPTFLLAQPHAEPGHIKCKAPYKKLYPAKLKQQLQKMALARLEQKVAKIKNELKTFSAEKIFYHKFLRALGYPQNKNLFELLALKIPSVVYEKEKNNADILLALYLGMAGFLDGTYNDLYALKMQKYFSIARSILDFSPLKNAQWQFSATRSANHPHYRLAAWVAFLIAQKDISPFQSIYRLLQERRKYKTALKELLHIFMQQPGGYWVNHFALDKPLKSNKNKCFTSAQRAKEIIINLIIPLSIAIASVNDNHGFISYLEGFYLTLPGNPNYLSTTRKRPWLNEYRNVWNSFSIGQSYLYLETQFCQKIECANCPLQRVPFS